MIIAIDGPSGAGKSSVSKLIAEKLGFSYLDTGAMYRSVAWLALQKGIPLDDDAALGKLALDCKIEFISDADTPSLKKIFIDGDDVTDKIRTAEIDKAVSPVSAAPSVREAMVAQQQRIGHTGNFVVEGRDICTVVFPDAEVKVFLTASDIERAHRRAKQNAERGVGLTDFDEVLADIHRRDTYDSTRETSPLRPAEGATILDSSYMTIEEVRDEICSYAAAVK